jgi:hypothetical protein
MKVKNFEAWKLSESMIYEDMESSDGLALFANGNNLYTLYDPRLSDSLDGSYFRGMVRLKENEEFNALEVTDISATKGYGPILYLIAMTIAKKRGMGTMPDQRDTPSKLAIHIYNEFFNGRGKDLVTTEPVDTSYEAESLNQVYHIINDIDILKLTKLNEELLRDNDNLKNILLDEYEAGNQLFDQRNP